MKIKINRSHILGLLPYVIPMSVFLAATLLLFPFGNFPLNDDWVYSRDVLASLQNGKYSISGFESAWGIPQVCLGVILAKLFPFSHGLLRCVGIVSALFCVAGIILLLKRRGVKDDIIVFLATGFAFCPPIFLSSPTFLTDIPFLALWIWTLVLWEVAWDKKSYLLLFTGFVLCILCEAQRQFGIALPISFAGIVILQVIRKRKLSTFDAGVFAASLASCLAYFAIAYWWKTLSSNWSAEVPLKWNLPRLYRALFPYLVYIGLFFFILYADWENTWKRIKAFNSKSVEFRFFILASGAFTLLVLTSGLNGLFFPYFKNLISEFGVFNAGEVLSGVRPIILPESFQIALTFLGWAGGVLILFFVIRAVSCTVKECLVHDSDVDPRNSINLVGFSSFTYFILLVMVREYYMFDRYLLAVIPGLIILLSSQQKTAFKNILPVFMLLLMGCFSFSITSDWFRWNEARWEAGTLAVKQGLHPVEIEGGYEWNGWFRTHNANETDPVLGEIPSWSGSKEISKIRAVISFSKLPDIPVIRTFSYSSYWEPRKREMYLQGTIVRKQATIH